MSIREEARQEAERRWPALNPDAEELTYPRSAIRQMTRGAFIAGAVWAHEQDTREPSEDPCPEWKCPDLSSEDRREGKTCPDHPCTCTGEPSDAEVLAALNAYYAVYMTEPITSLDAFDVPPRAAKDMRAALLAAKEVRRG